MRGLEKELRGKDSLVEQLWAENAKLKKTIARYKDKWDALREGAKKRERNASSSAAGGVSGSGGSSGGAALAHSGLQQQQQPPLTRVVEGE